MKAEENENEIGTNVQSSKSIFPSEREYFNTIGICSLQNVWVIALEYDPHVYNDYRCKNNGLNKLLWNLTNLYVLRLIIV